MLLGSWLKRACWHSPERFDYNMHLTMSSANPLEGSTSSAAARQPRSPPSDNTTHSDIQHSHSPGRVPNPLQSGNLHLQPRSYIQLPAHAIEPVPSLPHSLSVGEEKMPLSLFPTLIFISPLISPFASISLFLLCWKSNNKKRQRERERGSPGFSAARRA